MTRTIFIGKPTKEQKKTYSKVLYVQQKGVDEAKEGIKYKDLDINSRKRFGKLKKNFKHALGHGVGKKVHQRPNVNPKAKGTAKTGDIITIEPGIYFPGRFGIRIEDTVKVGKNKCEVLTKSDKKLITIK